MNTMTETNITNEQLEAWAGLGPWEWGENWLYVVNHNENPDPVLWYTTNDDGVHAEPDNAALIASAPALAAALLAERKAREVEVGALKHALSYAIQAIDGEIPNLDEQMCCNGHECGCYGSTNRCLLLHDLRQALKGPTP